VRKFESKRLFNTTKIKYHLGNLSPDTIYFFQIQVIIEALQSVLESDIYKLPLSPIPSSATTATTTTTVPTNITLDVQLKAVLIDYSSLNISWRQFNPQEKKFIDGIRIRYKNAEQDENEWQLTQVLHRDVRSYVLRNLDPEVSYAVKLDLFFNSNPDIPTHIISTTSIVTDMPSKARNEVMDTRYFYPVIFMSLAAVIGLVIVVLYFIRKKLKGKLPITEGPSKSHHGTIE
jgi:hypothetical protein